MASGKQQEMTVPGLRTLSKKYSSNAKNCQDLARFLKSQNESLYWQSEAATAFKEHMASYMKALNDFHRDFTGLSQELESRADLIEQSQRR